jgi:hypothetical protein
MCRKNHVIIIIPTARRGFNVREGLFAIVDRTGEMQTLVTPDPFQSSLLYPFEVSAHLPPGYGNDPPQIRPSPELRIPLFPAPCVRQL